jgi:hypothetical protein
MVQTLAGLAWKGLTLLPGPPEFSQVYHLAVNCASVNSARADCAQAALL